MTAGKPFRVRKESGDGETLRPYYYNACRACYAPIDAKQTYCGPTCQKAHHRLRGTR
jgi:hypothetical protein